jgi:thiamine biosynthesis protein ThiS
MKFIIIGEDKICAAGDLAGLLAELKIAPQVVVVEKNGKIIPRGHKAELFEGDKLEIVRFVGGG